MLEAERHSRILQIVNERFIVTIAELRDMVSACTSTVRRDIDALAEQGECKRIRGGAQAVGSRQPVRRRSMPFHARQRVATSQKRAIAETAASLITPGDTLIIGGGTTTFGLIEFLARCTADILTNSLPLAVHLLAMSRSRVSICGGMIVPDEEVVVSPFDDQTIDNFCGSKMFTGCFGIGEFGIVEADPLIAHAQVRLLGRAQKVIVMADSTKLQQQSSLVVAGLDRVSTIVVDDGASSATLDKIAAAGINVIVAETGRKGGS